MTVYANHLKTEKQMNDEWKEERDQRNMIRDALKIFDQFDGDKLFEKLWNEEGMGSGQFWGPFEQLTVSIVAAAREYEPGITADDVFHILRPVFPEICQEIVETKLHDDGRIDNPAMFEELIRSHEKARSWRGDDATDAYIAEAKAMYAKYLAAMGGAGIIKLHYYK